jgi:hypothetical protein
MKLAATSLFVATILSWGHTSAAASPQLPRECNTALSADHLSPIACHNGRVYRIKYEQRKTRIVLSFDNKQTVLRRIPQGFDPSLVGSDSLIGFLSDSLQPYKSRNLLLYVSAIRTNGGGGGGQCGSGSEIYLNVLDTSRTVPRTKSSILIGSCDESIGLLDQNIGDGQLGEVSVVENKLSLHFMYYRNLEGYPVGTVAPDFKSLLFR